MSTRDSRPVRTVEPRRSSVSALRVAIYVAVLIAFGATLAVTAASAETGQTADPASDAVVVDLDGEGDAVVETTVAFDLADAEEQTRFEAFVGSEQRQQAQLAEYESGLDSVATDLEAQTGREMDVTGAGIEIRSDEEQSLGLVVLTATWEGLAAAESDQLVLEQPFDSGFDADRRVVVRPPAGYQVVTATPTPSDGARELVWNSEQSLDGFEVVVEPQGDDTDSTDDGTDAAGDGDETAESGDATGPGFGFGVVVTLLTVVALRAWPGDS